MTFAASQSRSHIASLSLLICKTKLNLFQSLANFPQDKINKRKRDRCSKGKALRSVTALQSEDFVHTCIYILFIRKHQDSTHVVTRPILSNTFGYQIRQGIIMIF